MVIVFLLCLFFFSLVFFFYYNVDLFFFLLLFFGIVFIFVSIFQFFLRSFVINRFVVVMFAVFFNLIFFFLFVNDWVFLNFSFVENAKYFGYYSDPGFAIINSSLDAFDWWLPFGGFRFSLYYRATSLLFSLLTVYIIILSLFIGFSSIRFQFLQYLGLVFIIEFFLLSAFLSDDILLFYISFEAVLIPMYLIIGLWGSRGRKSLAAYYFFFYTLVGSVFMLLSVLYVILVTGCTSICTLHFVDFSTCINERILFLGFFLAFASKVPMFPFHLWLPEAHVEAPTPGSVILASLLLKLGGYGFYILPVVLFPHATIFYQPLIFVLCFFGVNYGSFLALSQKDLKKIIAYSSVVHMNFAIAGLFSLTLEGVVGSFLLMIGHGFVSGALFFLIGVIYDRYGTRELDYFGGFASVMPVFSIFLFFFTISNFSFPCTATFVGEILVFFGLIGSTKSFVLLIFPGFIIGAAYSVLFFARIALGFIKIKFYRFFADVNNLEFLILVFFAIPAFFISIFPSFLTVLLVAEVRFYFNVISGKFF